MSDEGSTNRDGKYAQRYNQPIDNPEIPESKDWWNEICKANGEKNYWDKNEEEQQ
tara:strand:+ start:1067 stop:1231 length:165 start_codon:yes stop_codon:yes gene_type:complete